MDQSSPQAAAPRDLRLMLAAVLVLASFAAFVLPFLSPPREPVLSVAYVAGASNRAATIALAAISVTVLLLFWRRAAARLEAPASLIDDDRPVPRGMIAAAVALVIAELVVLGPLILHTGVRYGDADYFLSRLRDLQQFPALVLYRDLEFAYGPMLLRPTLWLAHTGVPLGAAYFITLAAMDALGLAMVAYVVNRLPLTSGWRRLLFGLCALVQLEPVLSPNYSLFKFLLPYAAFLWAARQRSPVRAAAAFAAAVLAVLLDSPELGVGMTAGVLAYAAVRGLRGGRGNQGVRENGRGYLLALLSPVAAYPAFLPLAGMAALTRLAQAGKGALNLILDPMPYVLIVLFAVVWLAPRLVGTALGSRRPQAPELAGLFVLALGILPGALGRVYLLHLVFDGMGFLLLSAVAAQRLQGRQRIAWAAALTLVFASCFLVATGSQREALRLVAADSRLPGANANTVDLARLDMTVGADTPVALPITAFTTGTERALRATAHYRPDFYPGLGEIWTPAGERRKIAAMRQFRWALLPKRNQPSLEPLPNGRLRRWLRLGYRYPQRNPPYRVGVLLEQEIRDHWVPAGSFDDLELFHRES